MSVNTDLKIKAANRGRLWPLSRYRLLTYGCLVVAIGLLLLDYRLTVLMTGLYLLLVLTAPYSFRLGLFLPVIYRISAPGNQISLTFDDGPDPEVTPHLLILLAKYNIKGTFFVVGNQVKKHPHLVKRMLEEGHEIGNHSQKHDPFLMLKPYATIYQEIEDCQKQLKQLGIVPYAFRPPVGITNPKLFPILLQLGLYCVGFSCRPRDFGNRRITQLSTRVIKKVKPGDIVLLHDKKPNDAFSLAEWLSEIELIIKGIREKGLEITPLSGLINRPVMKPEASSQVPDNPVQHILDYHPELDVFVSRPTPNCTSQLMPAAILDKLIPGALVMDLDGSNNKLPAQISGLVGNLTIKAHSQEQANHLHHKIKTANLQNVMVSLATVNGKQADAHYDVIYAFQKLLFESSPECLFKSVFAGLSKGGIFYALMPKDSFSGRLLAIKTALATGLKLNLFKTHLIRSQLEAAGFREVLIESSVESFNRALVAVTAIK